MRERDTHTDGEMERETGQKERRKQKDGEEIDDVDREKEIEELERGQRERDTRVSLHSSVR